MAMRKKKPTRRKRRRLKPTTMAKIKNKKKSRIYSRRYLKIMNEVRARDQWTCGLCDATGVKLQVHHIVRHADSVALRQNRRNLISLCRDCHSLVTVGSKERLYAPIFKAKVARNTDRYRKEKLTYEEYLEKLKKYQQFPDSFEGFKYKTEDEVKRNKAKEHYLRVTWRSIKYRTTNKNSPSYKRYGGRGIKMCAEWLNSFEKFKEYINEHVGERPDGYSIDRINNDGHYEPGNVRWASAEVQKQNNSQTKLDPAVVLVIFILYHKYKFKQYQIMHKLAINTPTLVSNICKFVSWKNITCDYSKIVKNEALREKMKQYVKSENELQ